LVKREGVLCGQVTKGIKKGGITYKIHNDGGGGAATMTVRPGSPKKSFQGNAVRSQKNAG